MCSKLLGAFSAILLLCASAMPAVAASAKPGSVEPAGPSSAQPAPAADGNAVAPTRKKAAKAKVRKHRYARRHYRHGFFIPAPRFWFRTSWPRHRHYRGHRRSYAGFPFYFRFRW